MPHSREQPGFLNYRSRLVGFMQNLERYFALEARIPRDKDGAETPLANGAAELERAPGFQCGGEDFTYRRIGR